MGLAWQQGPLATATVGHFLTPEPLPQPILYAEPLRRRMRVRFADQWIAESEDVVLLHETSATRLITFPKRTFNPLPRTAPPNTQSWATWHGSPSQ